MRQGKVVSLGRRGRGVFVEERVLAFAGGREGFGAAVELVCGLRGRAVREPPLRGRIQIVALDNDCQGQAWGFWIPAFAGMTDMRGYAFGRGLGSRFHRFGRPRAGRSAPSRSPLGSYEMRCRFQPNHPHHGRALRNCLCPIHSTRITPISIFPHRGGRG